MYMHKIEEIFVRISFDRDQEGAGDQSDQSLC